MRVKLCGQLGAVWPETTTMLINSYRQRCEERGLVSLEFSVDGLAKSLNNQYSRGLKFCKPGTPGAFQDKSGKWRVQSQYLKPEVIDWRHVVAETLGDLRWTWKPTGVTAAVILLAGQHWITARRLIREEDADNKVKPTLDAVQHSTGTPDELHWEVFVSKVLSKRRRTFIFLYDLGDVVEYYS